MSAHRVKLDDHFVGSDQASSYENVEPFSPWGRALTDKRDLDLSNHYVWGFFGGLSFFFFVFLGGGGFLRGGGGGGFCFGGGGKLRRAFFFFWGFFISHFWFSLRACPCFSVFVFFLWGGFFSFGFFFCLFCGFVFWVFGGGGFFFRGVFFLVLPLYPSFPLPPPFGNSASCFPLFRSRAISSARPRYASLYLRSNSDDTDRLRSGLVICDISRPAGE